MLRHPAYSHALMSKHSETEQHRLDKENLGKGKFDQERNITALQVNRAKSF